VSTVWLVVITILAVVFVELILWLMWLAGYAACVKEELNDLEKLKSIPREKP
jgi:hypothetical protein